MLPLYIAAIACAAVWVLVAVRAGWLTWDGLTRLPWLAYFVVLTGSIAGYEFWNRQVGPLPLTLDRILWGLLMLECCRQWSIGRWRLRPLLAIDWLVLGLFLVLVLSTFTHDFRYRENLPLSRLLFFNVLPLGIYFVARHAPLTERDLKMLVWGTAGFSLYLACTGIAEWRGWNALVFPQFVVDARFTEFLGRARGPFLNPVVNGTFMTTGLLALAWLWSRVETRGRILLGCSMLVVLVGVYATLTRSVWIALLLCVGGTGWLLANTRQRGLLLIGGTVALVGVLAATGGNLNSFKRDKFVSESDMAESAALRPLLAQVAWQMFLDKPVVGHGFGQYTQAKRLYHQQVTDEPLKKVLPYMQHNVILSYLTETGALGVLLLIGIWVLYARAAWQLIRTGLRQPAGMIGLLGWAILICYMVNGMFHDVSIMPSIGSLYFLFLGLVTQLAQQQAGPTVSSI